jgi:hypothetical protein
MLANRRCSRTGASVASLLSRPPLNGYIVRQTGNKLLKMVSELGANVLGSRRCLGAGLRGLREPAASGGGTG